MVRAENMAKRRVEEERKAAEAEQERLRCEAQAAVVARKRTEAEEKAALVAKQREHIETQLLEHEERHLAHERELLAQTSHLQSLAGNAEKVLRARLEEERMAVQLEEEKIAAEQAALDRAKEIIEAAQRQYEETALSVAESIERRVAEEQCAIEAEQARLKAEQAAYELACERILAAEQAEQIALRQHEEEIKLLSQQQQKLEIEQRVLSEIELRVKSEEEATAALIERGIAEQKAIEAAQNKIALEKEKTLLEQQRIELNEQENVLFNAQIEEARTEVEALKLMAGMRKKEKIIRLVKVAGLSSAIAAIIGLSLPVFYAQHEAATVQPAMKQADKNAAAAIQAEPENVQIKPDSPLVQGDLKMSDQLGSVADDPLSREEAGAAR
jgi:hypothetical protein